MARWVTNRITDEYREIINRDTGAIRKVPFASQKQWDYLESLRLEFAKNPDTHTKLKNRPTTFQASKQIDKLLARKQKRDEQQKLHKGEKCLMVKTI